MNQKINQKKIFQQFIIINLEMILKFKMIHILMLFYCQISIIEKIQFYKKQYLVDSNIKYSLSWIFLNILNTDSDSYSF
jgi:hypothetical protein